VRFRGIRRTFVYQEASVLQERPLSPYAPTQQRITFPFSSLFLNIFDTIHNAVKGFSPCDGAISLVESEQRQENPKRVEEHEVDPTIDISFEAELRKVLRLTGT
jgi:hypothetical protein